MNQKKAYLIGIMMVSALIITGSNLEAKETVTSKVIPSGGIHVIEFTLSAGKVYINLPDDMAAGDQVSGKLTIWPSGKSYRKKAKNKKILEQYKIDVDGKITPAGKDWDKWTIKNSENVSVRLINSKGKPVSTVNVPIKTSGTPFSAKGARTPDACIAGNMFPFSGKFDGDFSNTNATINGSKLVKWAESPRRLILASPRHAAGEFQIIVREGATELKSNIRNLTLETRIGKNRLLKGETTTLAVKVKGLEGLTRNIPLRLINNTPGIVSLKEKEIFYISPAETQGGAFSFNRVLTGVTPGNFHISVTIPGVKNDCDEILKKYNEVKGIFDKQDKDCRELQKEVDRLKARRDRAKAERDRKKKDLDNRKKDLDDLKKEINNAAKDLKKLIDSAIHVDGISSEPGPGMDNFVGLAGSDVGIHFSGSQRSIDVVSWFLNEYRDKWSKLSRQIRNGKKKMKEIEKDIEKKEKDLKDADKELSDAEKELKEAEAKLAECLKGKAVTDHQLKDLDAKYKECLKILENLRICKENIDDASEIIDRVTSWKKFAENLINKTREREKALDKGASGALKKLDNSKKLLEESDRLRKKAEETLERAKKEYLTGNTEEANKLAAEAKKLVDQAYARADDAADEARRAQDEVLTRTMEENRAAEEKLKEKKRQEAEAKREKEWWERFLSEPDPTPHDVNGGSRNLAIGLSDLIDKHILDNISGGNFGDKKTLCDDKCLIAVKNTFGKQWRDLLSDMAWDVFLGSMTLPATITKTSTRLSFSVFKGMVGKLVKSDSVIPLWGKFTYEHEHQGFKHMSVGKFNCEIESFLVYNKKTGYVTGMVLCNCCGKVSTLYIKYKVDENGRALKRPFPRIEFR